ncbi:hypothetical protein MPER_03070 [Moniliophthora perniciosa FA553]|nr:hypothetical protein MPER_03070 [Moniliophthora perniciosa FA553]
MSQTPNPPLDVQRRISAAIKNAGSNPDYTALVNPFIGTASEKITLGTYGESFRCSIQKCPDIHIAGLAPVLPFLLACLRCPNVKFTADFTGYAPAGYIADPTQKIRGFSPLHDSGTGSSSGSYGNFEVMPMTCDSFKNCTTKLTDRQRLRQLNTDDAYPGYFTTTIDNGIKIEATSTRRAGIERFTFPNADKPYFVIG